MFYSQFLLLKNAPLGLVWMAGHCLKRLKEEQIRQMDISGAVDEILGDEVRVVAHRVLAVLLLGVVRIFSRKVENVYDISQEILKMLLRLSTGLSKRVHAHSRSYHGIRKCAKSISLPKRFELDVFEIENFEDQESAGANKRPHPEDMLAVSGKSRTKDMSFKEKLISEPDSITFTPPRDVLSPERMMMHSFSSPSQKAKFPFATPDATAHENHTNDERPLPTTYSSSWNINMDHYSNAQLPFGVDFDGDDRLEPMVLDEDEDMNLNLRSSNENDFSTPPDANTCYVEENLDSSMEAPLGFTVVSDLGKGDEAISMEVESEKCLIPKDTTPTVVTPSSKDHATTRQRQKMIWDSAIVLSNRVYKKWLDDSSNLKRQKKKAKLFYASSCIFEPMHHALADLDSLEPKKNSPAEESSYCHEDALPSTDYMFDEQVLSSPDAPRTPVHQEMSSTLKNGNDKEVDLFTTTTRMLIGRKKEEVLKFSELVTGKTRRECAQMLYALLVLKSRGSIELQQEEAYGEILVSQ